jgi:hypothetical protein
MLSLSVNPDGTYLLLPRREVKLQLSRASPESAKLMGPRERVTAEQEEHRSRRHGEEAVALLMSHFGSSATARISWGFLSEVSERS